MKKEYAVWKLKQGLLETGEITSSSEDGPVEFFKEVLAELNLGNSPLLLLLNEPVKFFETNWPSLRLSVHRLTYTLRFETPLRLRQEVRYQFIFPESEDSVSYFYICSLSDYLPALEVRLNGRQQFVIKVDGVASLVLNKICQARDFRSICQHLQQRYTRGQIKELLGQAIRIIVYKNIPLFICVDSSFQPKQACVLSLSCIGNPQEFHETGSLQKFEERFFTNWDIDLPSSTNIPPLSTFRRLLIKISRFWRTLLHPVPLDEPKILWEIYSKSPPESVWAYIFAPKKFHLALNKASASDNSVKILHVSSKDPDAICLRLGPREPIDRPWKSRIGFKIVTPRTHKLWLGAINSVLVILGIIWLSTIAYTLGWFSQFDLLSDFGTRCKSLTDNLEFFSASVTFISFIFIARGWLIYEETVFRLTSLRFSAILLALAILALVALLL